MKKIKITQILDDIRSQTLVGNMYKLEKIDSCGMAITKCGRHFFEGEYEIVEGDSN